MAVEYPLLLFVSSVAFGFVFGLMLRHESHLDWLILGLLFLIGFVLPELGLVSPSPDRGWPIDIIVLTGTFLGFYGGGQFYTEVADGE